MLQCYCGGLASSGCYNSCCSSRIRLLGLTYFVAESILCFIALKKESAIIIVQNSFGLVLGNCNCSHVISVLVSSLTCRYVCHSVKRVLFSVS